MRLSVMPSNDSPPNARNPALGSLAHLFCDDHDYGAEEFMPAVMRTCLARHALPVYGLFGHAKFFSADRELIAAAAQARTMEEVEAAIDEYWTHPANRQWLRRVGRVRISTQRLRRFADGYLLSRASRQGRPGIGPVA